MGFLRLDYLSRKDAKQHILLNQHFATLRLCVIIIFPKILFFSIIIA